MEYNKACIDAIAALFDCGDKKANLILEAFAVCGIPDVTAVEKKPHDDGFAMRAWSADGQEYIAFLSKRRYHVYAIMDAATGKYVLYEYQ